MSRHPHCHWRDLKEWRRLGLDMSTASDEACKMFDATLTQFVNYCNDDTVGGMKGCIDRMIEADPEFGHVMKLATPMKRLKTDAAFDADFELFSKLTEKATVTPWEQKHVEALRCKVNGHSKQACAIWEDILIDHPRDMLSLKLLYDARAFAGNAVSRRDCCEKALPHWKPEMPLYCDLEAMHAFSLEETGVYQEAETLASKALDKNPHSVFASHCIAHCKEMIGQPEAGVRFMETTEQSWNTSMLTCHCYWHWALFYYEAGEFESAMGVLDTYLFPSLQHNKNTMALTDVASLCFRLEAEGVDVGRYWEACSEVARQHKDDRVWAFWDVHGILACTRAQNKQYCQEILDGMQDFINHGEGEIAGVYAEVVLPVSEALEAYAETAYHTAVAIMRPIRRTLHRVGASVAQVPFSQRKITQIHGEGDIAGIYAEVVLPVSEALEAYVEAAYHTAVAIMRPIRHRLHIVGASVAQRDLFTLFMIHAGLRSTHAEDVAFARQLLQEREASRGKTNLSDRLLDKITLK